MSAPGKSSTQSQPLPSDGDLLLVLHNDQDYSAVVMESAGGFKLYTIHRRVIYPSNFARLFLVPKEHKLIAQNLHREWLENEGKVWEVVKYGSGW